MGWDKRGRRGFTTGQQNKVVEDCYIDIEDFTGCNDNGGKSILGNEDYQDKFKEHDE
jgi:hypothetical protein